MSISARNQLQGHISQVTSGAVNDEVVLTLKDGGDLVAVVTHSSRETLGLAKGKDAIAVIKAPWVTLASEDCGYRFSARNQFPGQVGALHSGAVNSTVTVNTDAGMTLTAVITNDAAADMALQTGSRVIALVKASSVLIAVKA